MQYLIDFILIILAIWFVFTFWWVFVLIAGISAIVWLILRHRKAKKVSTQTSSIKDVTPIPSKDITEETKPKNVEAHSNPVQDSVSTYAFVPSINADEPIIHKLRKQLTDFVVVDIETTGLNSVTDGITQVSAVKYMADQPIDEFNTYVNPEQTISRKIELLTHITNEMVENAPVAQDAVRDLSKFIGGLPIVGHNVKFDIKFLIQNGLPDSEISYEDTLPISQSKLPKLKDHKLPTLKDYFGIVNQSHNSLDDCKTTGSVYRLLRDDKLDQITPVDLPKTESLAGLRFCITGQFIEASRNEITQFIELNGGRVTGSISGLTNYLLVGEQIAENLTDGVHSAKEITADKVISEGGKLRKITYDDLVNLVTAHSSATA